MNETLLEKALAVQVVRKNAKHESVPLSQQLELILSLLRGDVVNQQVASALGIPIASVQSKATTILFRAFRAGLIEIKLKGDAA